MKITNILVQGSKNAIPDVSSTDDYGSSGQRNVGEENIQLTPIQVNNIIG
jgi:hypothetical protein